MSLIDITNIKHVSIACLIQACLILWNVSCNYYGYAAISTCTAIVDVRGRVNYDITVSLLMKYYS